MYSKPGIPDGSRPPDTGGSSTRSPCKTPASSSLGSVESVGLANHGEEFGEADEEAPRTISDDIILEPDGTTPLNKFLQRACVHARAPVTESGRETFVEFLEELTAEAAVIVKFPVRAEGTTGSRNSLDTNDAQAIQKLYRRNRRRAVRLTIQGEGVSCGMPNQTAEDHFRRDWAPSTCDATIYTSVLGREPREPVPTAQFTRGDV